jgi:HK97 family phage prohead protease
MRIDEARALVGADEDERRIVLLPVSLRAKAKDDDAPVLEGYGAVFNEWTLIGPRSWGFMERIAPGAFAKSIVEDDVLSFFNHDGNVVLGRTKAKTLDLVEDAKGLRAIIHPPDTSAARDVVTLITRGDVDGMSFMFRVRKDEWEEPADDAEDALPKRTLLDVRLIEVGPVTMPAYPQTSIGARDQVKVLLEARAAREAQGIREAQAVRQAAADGDRARRLRLAQAGR